MGLFENLSMAFANIFSNKLRSFLTMLGIIIGIAAVITIQTIGTTMTDSITGSFGDMGANNITISLTKKTSSNNTGGTRLRLFMDNTPSDSDLITDEMLDEFIAAFPDDVNHLEITTSTLTATIEKYGDATTTITANLEGINNDGQISVKSDAPILAGRWIDNERDGTRKVCVVSEKFVEQAMGCSNQAALGQKITLTVNKQLVDFYVEGVYTYKEDSLSSLMSTDDDDIQTTIYIPLRTAQKLLGSGDGYQSLTVVTTSSCDATTFVNVAGEFFASFYTNNDSWTVKASSLSSILETLTSLMSTVSMGVSAIAAIALLVGGIGVMNIMTVSVTERTKEIGTRKALGAPSSAIRMQFITESIVLCAIGGAIGVALGIVLGNVISPFLLSAMGESSLEVGATIDVKSIVIAVGFSMMIGVFFGYYPANKAAKMNPIDALRYE